MFVLTLALVALLAPTAHGHNWVNSWSRSVQANTIAPALPSSGQPHAQVIAGQPLQIEWVCGHGSDVYFVLLEKKNAAKMIQHKEPLMNAYIDGAPNGMGKATLNMADRKYHRKATASLDWDGKDKQASPYFKSEIKSGSSSYIKRDQTFEGNFLGAPKNSGKDFHTAAQVHQFDYPDSCRVNDRKALYSNPKYPWIIGIYRYRICLHMPNRPDVANIRFPAGTAPGDYIIHYRWRGYYDAIDVQIVAGSKAVANPYGLKPPAGVDEPFGTFTRIDHCEFQNFALASTCGRVVTTPDTCVRQCARLPSKQCDGVNVVSMVNRNSVPENFRDQVNIPFDDPNCVRNSVLANFKAADVNANTFVCYPLISKGGSDIAAKYYVTNDPDDPAFYSTCFVRKPVVNFDMAPPAEAAPPAIWNYNGRCANCHYVKRNRKETVLPVWPISGVSGRLATSRCYNCDKTNFAASTFGTDTAKAPTNIELVADKSFCDGRNANWQDPTFHSCAAGKDNCEIRVVNSRSQELDVSLHDCVDLVKRDSRCSKIFSVHRNQEQEGRLQCFCYRNKDYNNGCCYKPNGNTCRARTNTNWQIYKIK